jgi:hypothetical protein
LPWRYSTALGIEMFSSLTALFNLIFGININLLLALAF